MSLIHWWPLNGNTIDLGLSPCTVAGNPAFVTNGKIGRGLGGGDLTMSAAATAQVFNKKAVSICFWLYNGGSTGCIFGTDGMTAPNNRRFTLYQYPTANDLHWSWQNEDSNDTFTSGVKTGVITSNAWTHICAVWDSGTARIYINGAQVATSTGTCTSTNWAFDTVIARANSTRYYNDIRIYNHALSIKEVKEISKGLVLHYNFEDPYIESTTNLISSVNSSNAKLPKAGNGVDLQSTSGDAYCSLALSTALVNGSTYTLSFDISNLQNGEMFSFGFYDSGMHNITSFNQNGRATITFTAWNTASKLTFDDGTRTNTTVVSLRNFQLEKKDHATPYVNGTRSGELVYDSSGYGYNGTVTGNCQIKSDSAAGKHSIYSPAGANYVERQNFPFGGFNADQQVTINAWVKIVGYVGSDWNTIFRLAATDARDQQLHFCYNSSGNIVLSQYSDDPQFTTNVALNTWAMITWVHYKDGSTAKCKYFVNGQQVGSTQSYSGLLNIQNNARLTLFYDSIRNNYGANLQMGDFKIYSTALSADDILAEYNRKAAIDKNGNLFTGEIVEKNIAGVNINKNNQLVCNLLATTMELSDGSLWAPVCVHYVPDGLFSANSATSQYTSRNIWSNFGAINDLERPENGYYEFYVMNQTVKDGPFSWYRFKQNKNPFSATWEDVKPAQVGTNVIRIGSSATSSYGGMYWMNSSQCAMCFANSSNGNWFCCGARAYWENHYIPSYNGEQGNGWQLVYMRISKHQARIFKNGVVIPTNIKEL